MKKKKIIIKPAGHCLYKKRLFLAVFKCCERFIGTEKLIRPGGKEVF
jgi:hypothetical protein